MKCLRYKAIRTLIILLIAILIIYNIDNRYSISWNFCGNYYNTVVYRPIEKIRPNDLNISIVIVFDHQKDQKNYPLAQLTVSCYARLHSYELITIILQGDVRLQRLCPQKDFMFRRHCALVDLLKRRDDIEYLLFVDGDMGVINPNHLIEDYITHLPRAELIFYERIFNYEIMAGAFILKRTNFTIDFLQRWVNYCVKLPASFHGTDNGAIHSVFLDVECGDFENETSIAYQCANRERCTRLWEASRNYYGLELYTSCARALLGDRSSFADGRLYLMNNRSRGGYFSRDGWLTGNHWSDDDFLLHGWQTKRLNKRVFAGWHSPLVTDVPQEFGGNVTQITESYCTSRDAASQRVWAYKDTFLRSSDEIREIIDNISRKTHVNHAIRLQFITYF